MIQQPFAFMAGQAAPTPSPPAGGIVTSGLAQHFDASNTDSYPGSGTEWFDLVSLGGAGYKFNLFNGVSYSTDLGGSLSFNGTNQYGTQTGSNPTLKYPKGNDFTVQMFFQMGPDMASKGGEPFGKWTGSSTAYNYAVRWDRNNTTLRGAVYDLFNCNPGASATSPVLTQPDLVTMRVNWTTNTMDTISSAEPDTASNTTIDCLVNIDNNDPLSLMRRGNNSNLVQGNVVAFLIYNRALSDAEITQNYEYYRDR